MGSVSDSKMADRSRAALQPDLPDHQILINVKLTRPDQTRPVECSRRSVALALALDPFDGAPLSPVCRCHCFAAVRCQRHQMKRKGEDGSKASWPGWRLFTPRDKNHKHKCALPNQKGDVCGEELSYNNTTHNFKQHLERFHPEAAAELKAQKDRARDQPDRGALPPLAPGQAQLSQFFDPGKVQIAFKAHKKYVDRIERGLVRFIAEDIRPFNAVEGSPSFSSLPFFPFYFFLFTFFFSTTFFVYSRDLIGVI